MTRAVIDRGVFATVLVLIVFAACGGREPDIEIGETSSLVFPSVPVSERAHEGFLYGRVTVFNLDRPPAMYPPLRER